MSVGRRASDTTWHAHTNDRCGEALQQLRGLSHGAAAPALEVCFVVDADGRLVGSAPLLTVLGAPAERPLGEVMSRPVPIPASAPEEALLDFFVTYGHLAYPVVDREGRLEGVVTVEHFSDLVFEGYEGQMREEALRLMGLPAAELEPTSHAAWLRLPALAITILGGFLGAVLISRGGLSLERLAFLALYLPVCLVVAERVAVRTLAARLAWGGRLPEMVMKEARSALLVAAVAGPATGLAVGLWQGGVVPGMVVGVATAVIIGVATVVALFAPLQEKAGAPGSPALYPIALAAVDVAAVLVYLVLTRLLFALSAA